MYDSGFRLEHLRITESYQVVQLGSVICLQLINIICTAFSSRDVISVLIEKIKR